MAEKKKKKGEEPEQPARAKTVECGEYKWHRNRSHFCRIQVKPGAHHSGDHHDSNTGFSWR